MSQQGRHAWADLLGFPPPPPAAWLLHTVVLWQITKGCANLAGDPRQQASLLCNKVAPTMLCQRRPAETESLDEIQGLIISTKVMCQKKSLITRTRKTFQHEWGETVIRYPTLKCHRCQDRLTQGVKAAIIMFQRAITNALETTENIESLSEEIEGKEKPSGKFRT